MALLSMVAGNTTTNSFAGQQLQVSEAGAPPGLQAAPRASAGFGRPSGEAMLLQPREDLDSRLK